jgi:hypothetical protein
LCSPFSYLKPKIQNKQWINYFFMDTTKVVYMLEIFGWPQVSQTAQEKPLTCLSQFVVDREANTKPIGLGPLPIVPLYMRGSPLGDLNPSIYRVSTETLLVPVIQSAGRFRCTNSSCRASPVSTRRPPPQRRHPCSSPTGVIDFTNYTLS